jgi:hypothetical protein
MSAFLNADFAMAAVIRRFAACRVLVFRLPIVVAACFRLLLPVAAPFPPVAARAATRENLSCWFSEFRLSSRPTANALYPSQNATKKGVKWIDMTIRRHAHGSAASGSRQNLSAQFAQATLNFDSLLTGGAAKCRGALPDRPVRRPRGARHTDPPPTFYCHCLP